MDALSGLAVDPKALGDLRARAAKDPEGSLKDVAKQFEALFLDMMLKSMRNAAPGKSLFDSEATRVFTGLLDQQMSRKFAETGGLGLADLLVEQLSTLAGSAVNEATGLIKNEATTPLTRAWFGARDGD